MSRLSISFLGTFDVKLDQQPITRFRSTNVQGLLVYLALQANRAFPRDTLATLFWPEEPDTIARKNLRQTLYQLRQILNDNDDQKQPFLLVTRQTIQFNNAGDYTLDVINFLQTLNDGDLTTAISIYNGDLLPAFTCDSLEFEAWLRAERERLHGLALKAMERLTARQLRNGRVEKAEATARRQLTLEPWSETAHQQLMEALALAGNRTAALAQFERCREILDEELGLPPSPETASLAQRIENNELRPIDPDLIAGRYSLEEEIGRGAMGIVYRGRDSRTGQTVAIKMLDPDRVGDNPRLVERFLREGEALRQLDHPNIVKMLAIDERDGRHYIVMDHITGGDLKALLNQTSPLPLKQALTIALDLADALTRAHHLDILHRDLKPANVLIDTNGLPRLTDFGIARLGRDSELTETGAVLGTFNYLSPEACMGQTLDERADIWSFGILLYELLTNEKPFSDPTQAAVIAHILNDPLPDIRQRRPDIPDALEDLLYRMLTKNRADRIPSVRLVGAEIEAILRSTTKAGYYGEDGRSLAGQFGRQPSIFDTPTPERQRRTLHNLPLQANPFIGREGELTELERLLTDTATRLITIVGPGGMGKTRLSIEAASRLLDSPSTTGMPFPDGIFFVELASLTSIDQMNTAVAAALGFALEKDFDPTQQIINYLSNKKSLLLLDNYEHLLPAPVNGAQFVTTLIQAVPQVTIIATSRQKLNLNSEIIFALEGLAFPEWETVEDALSYSAVQLFVQSARRTRIDFEIMAESLPYVTRICQLTEGMPLGIVLAAAWIDMLSLSEIATEMQNDIDFLASEMSDLPPRQRSMRAVFDYSWALLSEKEQAVLAKLSVFHSGFTRDAAQKVTGATLRQLLALVNKSLVQRDVESGRFSIHELLNQLTAEKLESRGESSKIRTAHSRYYLQLLANQGSVIIGKQQRKKISNLTNDNQNIKSAWLWAAEKGEVNLLLPIIELYHTYTYFSTGDFELVEVYRKTLSLMPPGDKTFKDKTNELTMFRASILNRLQELGYPTDNFGQPIDIDLLHQFFGESGQKFEEAIACQHLGNRALRAGNAEQAFFYFQSQIRLYEEINQTFRLPNSLSVSGAMAFQAGQIEAGYQMAKRAIELARQSNNRIGEAAALLLMGIYQLSENHDYTRADEYFEKVSELGIEMWSEGLTENVATIGLAYQGYTALLQGNLDRAKQFSKTMEEIVTVRNNQRSVTSAFSYLSLINATIGKYTEISPDIFESLTIGHSFIANQSLKLNACGLGNNQLAINTIINDWSLPIAKRWPVVIIRDIPILASILAGRGEPSSAAELIATSKAHPSCPHRWWEIMVIMQELETSLEAELSPEEYTAAKERGREMDVQKTAVSLLEKLKSMLA